MILEPIERSNLSNKTAELYSQFEQLTLEIKKKRLPEEVVFDINKHINELNAETDSDKLLRKLIRKKQSGILELLEKKLKIVTKNHFRNKWMALGMLVFGIPIGTALGSSLGNMAFLGIGIPIGLSVGLAVGTGMDKKAFEEGRQLDIELKM